MRCLICETPDYAAVDGGTSFFDALFGQLARDMAPCWWLIDGGGNGPWSWPSDWNADEARLNSIDAELEYLEGSDCRVLAYSPVFERYMRYLSDFWIDVYAFPSRPKDLSRTRKWKVPMLPQIVSIPLEASHVFINVDGSYWAMLSENPASLWQIGQTFPRAQTVDAEPCQGPA